MVKPYDCFPIVREEVICRNSVKILGKECLPKLVSSISQLYLMCVVSKTKKRGVGILNCLKCGMVEKAIHWLTFEHNLSKRKNVFLHEQMNQKRFF